MFELYSGQFGPQYHFAREASRGRWSHDALLVLAAHDRFERAQRRAQARRLWAWITRRSRCLHDLSQIRCATSDRRSIGLQFTPIDSIRGSEGRCHDFDCDFLPLQSALAQRLVSIYVAIFQELPMPPVELIRAGDVYFVRDGHHRISVAHLQGRPEIEAEVTVWNIQPSVSPAAAPLAMNVFQTASLKAT